MLNVTNGTKRTAKRRPTLSVTEKKMEITEIISEEEGVETQPIPKPTPPPAPIREGAALQNKLEELSKYQQFLEKEIGYVLQLQNDPKIAPKWFKGEVYNQIQFFNEELKKFNEISLEISKLKKKPSTSSEELRGLYFKKRIQFKNCISCIRSLVFLSQAEIRGVKPQKGYFDFKLNWAYVQFRRELQYKLDVFSPSSITETDPLLEAKKELLESFLIEKLGCSSLKDFLEDCFTEIGGFPGVPIKVNKNFGDWRDNI